MSDRVPKYRFHKASGQALVEIRGRHIYLGKFDSPESHELYRRLIARYLSQDTIVAEEAPRQTIPIDRLILQYLRFAKTYYVKNGEKTDATVALRIVLRRLRKLYGQTEAENFGPKALKIVRESLIQEGLSRAYINASMARSATFRQNQWDCWQSVATTRLRPGALTVVIQTRWHRDDLTG